MTVSPARPITPSAGAPVSSFGGDDALLDARVQASVRHALARRFTDDQPPGMVTQVVCALVVVTVAWSHVPIAAIMGWFGALAVVVGYRVVAWRRAQRDPDPVRVTRALAVGSLACDLVWSVAAFAACFVLDGEHMGVFMLVAAGLVAGSTGTLLAHPRSFAVFVVLFFGALLVGMSLTGLDPVRTGQMTLVVIFGLSMGALYRRSHRQLVSYLEATARLSIAEDRVRRFVDDASDALWRMDFDGRWTFVNAACERLYAMPAAGLIGRHFIERARADYTRRDVSVLTRVFAGHEVRDHESVHIDALGQEHHVSICARLLRDDDGTFLGVQGTTRDISERVAKQRVLEDLARQGSLLRSLLDNTDDLIFHKLPDGTYSGCNAAMSRLLGRDEAEIIGRTNDGLYPAERAARLDAATSEAFATRRAVRLDEWVTRADGTRSLYEVVKTPFFNERGDPIGLVGIARDVTARKEAEDRMRELAEKADHATRMKSAFLANMSHEIRTPMNGVLGMLELMLDTELTVEQRKLAEVCQTSAESLLALLNDILDHSKIEAGHLELEEVGYDLQRVLAAAIRLMVARASEGDNELVLDIRPDVPANVLGDPGRLRQVITNLVANSIKFTKAGEVVVTVERVGDDGERPLVRFAVRDSGIGIAPDQQQSIFAEFTQADSSITRKYGGTGLGLSICQRLVALMGGELKVESELGKGSTFHFTVPLALDATTPADGSQPTHASLRGAAVLVVDDSPSYRALLRDYLEGAGAQVAEEPSVDDALARLREAARVGTPFHLVSLDLMMPGRPGFDLAREVQADDMIKGVRTMVLTSSGIPGDSKVARECGVGAYLTKPVSRFDFLWAASALLARRSGPVDITRPLITRHDVREQLQPLRILLADDVEVNRQVAGSMLRKRGHAVTMAANGREAIDAVARAPFDVVIMDVQMPEVDGLEATRRIRADARFAKLPIIALTAHALADERERCLAAGMNAFLSKPFKAHELFASVEGWHDLAAAVPMAVAVASLTAGTRRASVSGAHAAVVAAARAPVAPPVDLAGFREAMREAGVESIVDATVAVYLREAPTRVAKLLAGLDAGDLKEAGSNAHALKGSSGSLHASRLAGILAELEQACHAGDLAVARALREKLEPEWSRTLTYLQAALTEKAA